MHLNDARFADLADAKDAAIGQTECAKQRAIVRIQLCAMKAHSLSRRKLGEAHGRWLRGRRRRCRAEEWRHSTETDLVIEM
jgi:hypothetical protein